jgi:predicted ATPase
MTTLPPTTFGATLRRARLAAGLTQEALAEAAGLSVRGISDLERGASTTPRRDTVDLLLSALDLEGEKRDTFVAAARRRPVAATGLATTSIPVPPTSLIGREAEVAAIAALLKQPTVRLVTLAGLGGIGKTRLAIRAAADLAEQFADGVRFVDLARLQDPSLLGSTLVDALDLQRVADELPADQLVAALRVREMLLVLDNFEHLLPVAPLLSHMLGTCLSLKLLVTSRVVLRLSAEHVHDVEPLAVPDPNHLPLGEELRRYPAVQLFLERACSASPGFRLTSDNQQSIGQLCIRLEGLPLAIELAAARIRVLPPAAMLKRLDQRLQFLTVGSRDAPARQRTLRDTLTWSYDLLAPTEQHVLQRLAVFAGGWTLETAEAVCAVNGLSGSAILDAVSVLLDHSLVQATTDDNGLARFRMLETIREFALEHLVASGNEEVVRERHARCCLTIASNIAQRLHSPDWLAAHHQLGAELDNLRIALRWALRQHETDLALRLVGATFWSWIHLELHHEGRGWVEEVLAQADGSHDPSTRGHALLALGICVWRLGDLAAAPVHIHAGRDLFLMANDSRGVGIALEFMGMVVLGRGDVAAARATLVEAVQTLRTVGDAWHLTNALYLLGEATIPHDPEAAGLLYEESLAGFRKLGDPWGIGWPLGGLGGLALHAGNLAGARALFEEALTLRRMLGQRWTVAIALTSLGEVARREGDQSRALEHYREALTLFQETGDLEREAWTEQCLGFLSLETGDVSAAARHFEDGLALRRKQGHLPGIAAILEGISCIAVLLDQFERANSLFVIAGLVRERAGAPPANQEQIVAAARKACQMAGLQGWVADPLTTSEDVYAAAQRDIDAVFNAVALDRHPSTSRVAG